MAFVTRYRGLEVQCETIEDLNALADQMQLSKSVSRTSRHGQRTPPSETSRPSLLPTEDPMRQLIPELSPQQLRLLSEIAKDQKSDSELRHALALSNNKALAGILAGISKAAKRIGLQTPIEKSVTRSTTGEREYTYTLESGVIEEVKQALNSHA